MRGAPGGDYESVIASQLEDGQTVIVERMRFDYKTGAPGDSVYYRAIVGHHKTVSGLSAHLVNEPDAAFPQFAPWAGHWIYAENNGTMQMWREK